MHNMTDVGGVLVGHAHDLMALTGCTAVLTPLGAVAGVDVRGSAPGTRETDLMRPCNLVERVHGVMLSGGSAYGLDTASGAMQYLEEQGHGFSTPYGIVPIVGAAVIYDLGVGDPRIRPDAAMGYRACAAASSSPCAEGNVGAGAGATLGKMRGDAHAMKGGVGCYSQEIPRERRGKRVHVGAVVVVNSLGDVVNPWTGAIVAGAYDRNERQFVGPGAGPGSPWVGARGGSAALEAGVAGVNTTIAVVATDAMLDKEGANKVAQMAQDGLARSIIPAHTMYDGDVVFCLSTGSRPLSRDRAADITLIGSYASQVLAMAVVRAAMSAESAGGCPAARDVARSGSDPK